MSVKAEAMMELAALERTGKPLSERERYNEFFARAHAKLEERLGRPISDAEFDAIGAIHRPTDKRYRGRPAEPGAAADRGGIR
jgi:hypothetical protein